MHETARRTWKVSTTTTHSASSTPPNDYSRRSTRPAEAEQVRKLRVDLASGRRRPWDTKAAQLDLASVAADNLPPWREILSLHPRCRERQLQYRQFAADLYTVAQGKEAGEYSDPVQFFERTYRRTACATSSTAMCGAWFGDMNASPWSTCKPISVAAKHSMLALWHLASGWAASNTPTTSPIWQTARCAANRVRRVALVGNQMEPAKTDTTDGRPGIRTIWENWRGSSAARRRTRSSPTPTAPPPIPVRPCGNCSPCIPRRDPHRRMGGVRTAIGELGGLPAGDFDTQFTFAQTLTEAAKATKGIQVVISIPASYDNRPDSSTSGDDVNDEEVGGEYGREALNRLKSIVGRTADHWLPANPQESFEIVRRRIFAAPDGATLAKISSIAKSLVDYYRRHSTEFPARHSNPPTSTASRRRIRSIPNCSTGCTRIGRRCTVSSGPAACCG